ncbi:hypothetical protein ACMAZE_03660 [Pseudopelagicola sp. nBUS_20]|uniref:hypothetical protein n=1 Tax=Pseudopelagicola sp. nBUS_20 TaxID=3395317 RepID=UPI003EC0D603
MRLEELVDKMIPPDLEKDLPSFTEILNLRNIVMNHSKISELESLLQQENGFSEGADINLLLKWLRKKNYSMIKEFEIKILEAYFSHPFVIQKLTGKASTLFPHVHSLPEFDFEILEPVMDLDQRIFSNGE